MKLTYSILIVLVIILISCRDDALFEGELYKNTVAFVSGKDQNIYEEVFELTNGESIGYISMSCGGTLATKEEIKINFSEDEEPLNIYNWSLYDVDEQRYAQSLPKEKYSIENYQITIPAGERTGRTIVKVRPEGLSPDSVYFIPLKAEENSSFELNEMKSTVLYRILIRNDYASQATESTYTMEGFNGIVRIAGNKKMHPLSWNRVRIMAGTEPYQSDLEIINKASIVLQINHDNRVQIRPYKDISVKQIDGDEEFPNIFKEETIGRRKYNKFLLCYEYSIGPAKHVIREELKMEIK